MSNEDVLLVFKAIDSVSSVASSIGSSVSNLGIVGYNAITQLSGQLKEFSNAAVESAKSAETGWIAFNNSLNKSGTTSAGAMNTVKTEVKGLANDIGVSVGDARSSFTTLNNKLGDTSQSLQAVKAAEALAVSSNQDLSSTTSILTGALNGKGAALKKMGIDIDNYKNKTTGAINTNKLFRDIISKNQKALTDYGNSATAAGQRLDNALAAMQTGIGTSMLNLQSATAPILAGIVNGLNGINDATGGVIYGMVGIGTSALGTLGEIANVTRSVQIMYEAFTSIKGAVEGVSLANNLLSISTAAVGMEEAGLTAVEVGAAAAHAGNSAALFTEAGAADMATISFMGLDIAMAPITITILAIVAAVAILVVAFEKVGEYFGWWEDWGTMLDSISAGVTRLWNAFMSSPQVQGTINDITNALNWLWGAIQPIVAPITSFFSFLFSPSGGEGSWSDPVGDIISAFGSLGKTCGDVVNWIKNIPNALAQLPQKANQFIMRTIQFFMMLPIRVALYLNMVVMRIIAWGQSLLQQGSKIVINFVNSFIRGLTRLPSMVFQVLLGVISSIINIGARAVSSAISLATNIVNGFKNSFKGIADYVYQELTSIPSKITQAISGSVSAITGFGSAMWDAFKSAIGANSPSMFYKQIAWDFEDIPNAISSQQKAGVNAVSKYGSALIKGFNYQNLSENLTLGSAQIGALNTMGNRNFGASNNALTTLIVNVNDGAFQLDARNFTTKECKQLFVNAIEGLDVVDTVTTKGGV